MAPPKGQPKTAKAVSGHAKKQHPSAVAAPQRHVVQPAIPLSMMPKPASKLNKRTPNADSTSRFDVSSLEAALLDHSPVPDGANSLQPAKISENEVNGSAVEKPEHTGHAAHAAHAAHAGPTNGSRADKHHGNAAQTNGSSPSNDAAHQSSVASVADIESVVSSASATDTNNQGNLHLKSSATESDFKLLQLITGAHDAPHHASQPQSATSSIRLELPATFHHPPHPLQHQLSTDQLPDSTNNLGGPLRMHHYQHHPHMSNGVGIMFGGFSESHTPSPVPLHGGFMPPPPPPVNGENHVYPRPNGLHHQHAHSNSNGFPGPVNTQFRPDMVPMSSIDTYGPIPAPVPHGPFEPFAHGGGRYGPPTPHSFHDSHASGEPNGVEGGAMPYPPNGPLHAGHAHHDPHVGHPHPAAHFPPFMHPQPFTRHPSVVEDDLMDSILYLRDQFDSGELTDCVLELVSSKGLHHPVKITGHKLILARSPALKQHIMAARASDSGSHTITLAADDQYLRSDAWWNAVRRLYLYPLLTVGDVVGNNGNGMDFTGDNADRFAFCLGYAAAGHHLHMQDVLIRGLQIAAQLINWNTVEEALGFVLEGAAHRHVEYDHEQDGIDLAYVALDFEYGPNTKILLDAIMNFLINAFPSNFELDTSVVDPPKFARIPAVAATTATSSPVNNAMPTIARGTSTRHPIKSTRLSSIKFGDLPAAYPEDGPAPQRDPAKCSPILSRVLLNLPFDELRAVLTSESNGVSGWNTAQDRYHAVADVVAEREARRLHVVDAVRARAVPGFQEIQRRLSAQRRHAIVEPWDILNWQEEVIRPRGAEVPRVVRKWVPQFSVASDTLQQQVQPSLYDVRDSMV
ncbi:hypothetical protein F4779DRAFT_452530 [Xylariaceae sp. FL0662B]|nr:hypothetical protein F4779DRAFT_452530 [Xylariaceae sp. FL0662B]